MNLSGSNRPESCLILSGHSGGDQQVFAGPRVRPMQNIQSAPSVISSRKIFKIISIDWMGVSISME
jgi:hypothetical protein